MINTSKHVERSFDGFLKPLSPEETENYNNSKFNRPKQKIDEIIVFQTGIFTDIFKLLSKSVNKKLETGELKTLISGFSNIEN